MSRFADHRITRRWLSNTDTIVGGVVVAYGLFYLYEAFGIPESSVANEAVGPKTLPVTVGIAIALAGLALAVKGLLAAPGNDAATENDPSDEAAPANARRQSHQALLRFWVIIGLLLAYILVFISLGYLISTTLFIFCVTTYLDRERLIRNLIYAPAFALVVYFLFTELLGVALPQGLLGI